MKDEVKNIMLDLNQISLDLEGLTDTLENNLDGLIELYDTEKTRTLLNVYLSVLKAIQQDSIDIYKQIQNTLIE